MEEKSIRFEDIPNAITGVLKKLSSLEDKIDGIYELVQSEKEETWFTVAELCAYLPTHPVEHTIYCWTSSREIPFHNFIFISLPANIILQSIFCFAIIKSVKWCITTIVGNRLLKKQE